MKYIELEHFETLIELYAQRDRFHDWSKEWEKYNDKIKNTIEWLKRNARVKEELR